MPEYDCLPPDTSATDFVTHMARMSGLPKAAARERTAEVLRHVGLYEERYRAIGGYSTGMKQRVKLAQALVHGPRLLLLDEPTNGLDPAGRDEMLALVRRTGTEFGIAVIVASHLLGEIERTCDFLVAIDAGRLLRAAPLGSFTERTGVLAVEVEEGADALAGALVGRGLQAVADGRTVLLAVAEEGQYDIVRDSIADLGLALVRLEQRRQSLEDLFRDDVPATAAQAASRGVPVSPGRVAERGSVVSGSPAQPARQPSGGRAVRAAASTTSATRPTTGRGWVVAARSSRSSRRRSGPVSGSGAAVGPRSRRSCSPAWPSCRPSSRSGSRRSRAGGGGRRRARGRLADHATRATTASSAS